jgi:VCBS repeat protein
LHCTNFSDECDGDIAIGNPQTCTIENVLVEQNFLDLAVANFGSNNVSILLGNGTGLFGTPATNFPVGTQPQSLAVGDFN